MVVETGALHSTLLYHSVPRIPELWLAKSEMSKAVAEMGV